MIKLMPQKNIYNTAFFNVNHSLDAILYLEQLQPDAHFIVGTPSKYIKLYSNLTLIALTLYMKFVQTYPEGLKMDATNFTLPKKILYIVLVLFWLDLNEYCRCVLGTSQISMMELACSNSRRILFVNYFFLESSIIDVQKSTN